MDRETVKRYATQYQLSSGTRIQKLPFYLGIQTDMVKYHWIEFDRKRSLEIGEVMELQNGNFCCIQRNDQLINRRVFFVVSTGNAYYLRCFLYNVDYLRHHFKAGVTIEVLLTFFYGDGNSNYLILDLINMIEEIGLKIHLILYNAKFSKEEGILLALTQHSFLDQDDVIVLPHLHTQMSLQFIIQTLKFVSIGQQVYFPTIVSNSEDLGQLDSSQMEVIALSFQDFNYLVEVGSSSNTDAKETLVEARSLAETAAKLGYRIVNPVLDY